MQFVQSLGVTLRRRPQTFQIKVGQLKHSGSLGVGLIGSLGKAIGAKALGTKGKWYNATETQPAVSA